MEVSNRALVIVSIFHNGILVVQHRKKESYSKQPFFLPKWINFRNSVTQAMLPVSSEKSYYARTLPMYLQL